MLGGAALETKGRPAVLGGGEEVSAGTCVTRKLIKSFVAAKCFVLGNSR